MRIRILTNNYPPEIGAAANQLFELAQALSARGHQVSVVTRFARHLPEKAATREGKKWIIKENRPEASVLRINIPQFSRRVPLLREIEHFLNFSLLVWAALIDGRVEATLVYSPPIVVGYAALMVKLLNGSRVVLNVQDLFPQSLIDLGVLKNPLLIYISKLLEKYLYKKVELITVMSAGNQKIVAQTAGELEKVRVIPNWVDTDFITPGERDNDFRNKFDLKDKFVLSFAGCIADSQDMDIILNSARQLEEYRDMVFLLAGNGPQYEPTIEKTLKMGLKNIKIIPIQPRAEYVKLLAASDVGLVTLNPFVATPVIPSKILSIMSAGRPVLASLPGSGDAPQQIKESGGGLVVEAGRTKDFVKAVLKLYRDPALRREMGRRGREYVIRNYSVKACSQKYVELFQKVITGENH